MDKYLNYNIQIYIYGQTKRTLHTANYCNLPSDLISLLQYYKSYTHTHTQDIQNQHKNHDQNIFSL